MCFEGRCLCCSMKFGIVVGVVMDTVISVAGSILAIDLFILATQKVHPDVYFSIFMFSLFIWCLINILFNITLIDGLICESQKRLIVYLGYSVLKNMSGLAAMVVAFPYFKFYEDLLVPSTCFFVLQIFLMICVYASYEKLRQEEMYAAHPLLEPAHRVVKPITEKKIRLDD